MNLYEILQNSGRVGEGMTHFERLFAQKIGGGKINEISSVPPLRYIGDGRPLTDYLISGDTVQDGTPSPENPVPVVGCGTDTAGEWTLPLTVNGTEYPIYLGTVPTTRRVKKQNVTISYMLQLANGNAGAVTENLPSAAAANSSCKCNIAPYGGPSTIGSFYVNPKNSVFVCAPGTTLSEARALLSGAVIWYVLATPETAVVNEPLMKIGDYADTVNFAQAQVTIPTVSGENVLDVPTEVKPSDVWIRGRIKEV